ncbi:hypothetical protein BS78_K177000 [Paspalum vaginatum]|uniref:Uncharacterized protein n=1 Tax=Paspalum vaginatum TaxID=158149 RepID=A0A9W7X955_9POAL|nr:hypothetical protein BS78_K177000 [Paspalum vaginatum]
MILAFTRPRKYQLQTLARPRCPRSAHRTRRRPRLTTGAAPPRVGPASPRAAAPPRVGPASPPPPPPHGAAPPHPRCQTPTPPGRRPYLLPHPPEPPRGRAEGRHGATGDGAMGTLLACPFHVASRSVRRRRGWWRLAIVDDGGVAEPRRHAGAATTHCGAGALAPLLGAAAPRGRRGREPVPDIAPRLDLPLPPRDLLGGQPWWPRQRFYCGPVDPRPVAAVDKVLLLRARTAAGFAIHRAGEMQDSPIHVAAMWI